MSQSEWCLLQTIEHIIIGFKALKYSAAKQQISWIVSLWRSPLTFVWPGVPKQCTTTAPSSQSERHLTVFCIDEILPGYVVYLVNGFNIYLSTLCWGQSPVQVMPVRLCLPLLVFSTCILLHCTLHSCMSHAVHFHRWVKLSMCKLNTYLRIFCYCF